MLPLEILVLDAKFHSLSNGTIFDRGHREKKQFSAELPGVFSDVRNLSTIFEFFLSRFAPSLVLVL